MSKRDFHHNHNQIVERLRLKIKEKKGKKCEIYDNLEEIPEILKKIRKIKKEYNFYIDPNLPIDLICVEKRKEKTEEGKQKMFFYYTIFLVVSTDAIPDSLENRILFYKFYLSRIISSKRFKIVLVTVNDTNKINEDFFQENGVGLWKFVNKNGEFEYVFPSLSMREQISENFEKSHPDNLPLFIDGYIHDAVDAIAGVTPEQFGKRYIDRKVMDKIFDLEKISFRKELFKLMNEHLTEKGDEYEFASEVFSKLWEEQIGIPYTDFLKAFEPSLQHVFYETREKSGRIYRDHYLHQFQVFLLGLFIMDKLYNNFTLKYKYPEKSWLIISSFHDMAYPVQLYDEWSGTFFNKIFKVSKELGHVELKSNFVDKSFLSCMGYLITQLCSELFKEEVGCNWLAEKSDLVNFFYKKITEAKNHCILSSIALLKMIQEHYEGKIEIRRIKHKDALADIFIPSALAISLHDKDIWKELRNMGKRQKSGGKSHLQALKFEDDPLSFLLIFCDNIQEWGRPSHPKIDEEEKRWKKFYLKDLKYNPERGFDFTMWTPNHIKTEKFFKEKKTELEEIETFLQQPARVRFVVHLKDRNDQGEDFEMQGSSF